MYCWFWHRWEGWHCWTDTFSCQKATTKDWLPGESIGRSHMECELICRWWCLRLESNLVVIKSYLILILHRNSLAEVAAAILAIVKNIQNV